MNKKEVYKLKKGKLTLIGFTVTLIVIAFFLFANNALSKEGMSKDQPSVSPEVQAENEKKSTEIENFLYGNSGIIKQVNDELKVKGYVFQTLILAPSIDEIQVKYVLETKEATVSEQEVVKSIFFEIVEKNNFNPHAFKLKVADKDDGPDW